MHHKAGKDFYTYTNQSFFLFHKAKQLFSAESKDGIKTNVYMSHCSYMAGFKESCYCYHHFYGMIKIVTTSRRMHMNMLETLTLQKDKET